MHQYMRGEEPAILLQVLEDITIEEKLVAEPGAGVARQYTLRLKAFPESKLPKDAQVTSAQVSASTIDHRSTAIHEAAASHNSAQVECSR